MLHFAAISSSNKVLAYLTHPETKNIDIDPSEVNKKGQTPLEICKQMDNEEGA